LWTQTNFLTEFYFAPRVIYRRVDRSQLKDKSEVPFDVFVAYPLLPTGPDGGKLQKYTGSDTLGERPQPHDLLGLLIHSFAHFSLHYSHGTLVFTDLQGLCDKSGKLCLFDVQAHTLMSSKLGEGSSGVGDHQRSLEKDGRSGFEYGTSCAVVWFSQRSQARVWSTRSSSTY